jgi:hypothetical protein
MEILSSAIWYLLSAMSAITSYTSKHVKSTYHTAGKFGKHFNLMKWLKTPNCKTLNLASGYTQRL